jgi:hypothetical protein
MQPKPQQERQQQLVEQQPGVVQPLLWCAYRWGVQGSCNLVLHRWNAHAWLFAALTAL